MTNRRKSAGQRGDRRADGEARQPRWQYRSAAEPVGRAAQQRHRGDVAEQEARDDRCGRVQWFTGMPKSRTMSIRIGDHVDVAVE